MWSLLHLSKPLVTPIVQQEGNEEGIQSGRQGHAEQVAWGMVPHGREWCILTYVCGLIS